MIRVDQAIRSVLAKLDVVYDRCSVQVPVPEEIARKVMAFSSRIPENALHNDGEDSKGREDDIHITVLYGLKDDPGTVQKIVAGMKPLVIRLGLVTEFMDKPEYDVIKIDAECPQLHRLHYMLRNAIDNDNKFPTYNPHMTVAYVKKGTGMKYLGDESFRGMTFEAPEMSFCGRGKDRTQIKFKS